MLLLSCGNDLKLHNCLSYDLLHVYRPADSTGQIRNVSWCKDGTWLTLVPNRGNAEIIRTKEDVRLLQTILGVPQPTSTVFQRTTKRNVAMSTVSGSVLIYDIKAKSIKKRFVISGSSVTMLDWSLKDSYLVAGSTDGQVTLYSNTTNQKTSVLTIPESKSVSVVRFHSTQRPVLGTASDEGVVVVWDIDTGRQKMCLKPHKAPITDLVFSSQNNKLMVSVGLDRTFQCYDTNAGVVALPIMTDHPLSAVDMAPDGLTVAVGSSRGTIYIYDLRQHERPLKIIAAHSGEIRKVLYQPYSLDSTTDSLQVTEHKSVDINLEPKSSDGSVNSITNMLSNVSEHTSILNNGNTEELMTQDEEIIIKQISVAGDSFLNGFENLDLSKRKTWNFSKEKSQLLNLGLSDTVKKWLNAKKNHLETELSSCESTNSNEKTSDVPIPHIKVTSSTPKLSNRDKISSIKNDELSTSNISPILTESESITAEDLNKFVSYKVKEELNQFINNTVKNIVSSVIKEQISDLTDSLSRFFLTMQLGLSKQFVGQENYMEKLFCHYCRFAADPNLSAQVQELQQENEFFKIKINEILRNNNP